MDSVATSMPANQAFNSKWCLWYHHDPQQWSITSYKKLCTMSTIQDFWMIIDTLKSHPTLLMEHLYIMREGVAPIWEDPKNRNGGCWSIKVDLRDSFTVLTKILAYVMGETSMIGTEGNNLSGHIMGVSFCCKNSFNAIIQIWNDDKLYSKIVYLSPQLVEPFIAEVIYRPHIPEY
jgi:hypothetical protein